MFQHDSFFFIGVFVFIFLLWLVTGGPTHPLSFTGPFLAGPGALGGGTYLSLPSAPTIGNVDVGQSHAGGASVSGLKNQLSETNYQVNQLQSQLNQVAAFGPPSPYRNVVTLSHYVSDAGSANPQNEYLQLYVSANAPGPVTLSGWSVRSEVTGFGAVIPQGTEVPTSGVINAIQPIVLNPGDSAIIDSGRSPIGASFRENTCIGYFSQFQSFSPSLADACPAPNSELNLYYGAGLARDPTCLDYVDRLSRCTLALSPPPSLSGSCQSFLIDHLNYNGCITEHQSDYDFKSDAWRIYLGRTDPLWRSTREVVKLLDSTGQTVDMFSY